MVVKRGRFGQFLACTGYPECKTTQKITDPRRYESCQPDQILDEKCPRCESNLVIKQGRFGDSRRSTTIPNCKYVKLKSTGVKCPNNDEGDIVERKSRRGKACYGCSNYPDREFTLWKRPIAETCPDCGTRSCSRNHEEGRPPADSQQGRLRLHTRRAARRGTGACLT